MRSKKNARKTKRIRGGASPVRTPRQRNRSREREDSLYPVTEPTGVLNRISRSFMRDHDELDRQFEDAMNDYKFAVKNEHLKHYGDERIQAKEELDDTLKALRIKDIEVTERNEKLPRGQGGGPPTKSVEHKRNKERFLDKMRQQEILTEFEISEIFEKNRYPGKYGYRKSSAGNRY